jgi:glyoxylase-like metal-dependent hydrolase (beta-lactamase superfamily II)
MTEALQYEVFVSDVTPVSGPKLPGGEAAYWSPLAHTLVFGPRTAALVDPPITRAQARALADWIAAHERELTYIYVTHWHGDHWLGAAELLHRFPGATVLSGTATRERMSAWVDDGILPPPWPGLFPGQLSSDEDLAAVVRAIEVVPEDGFEVDGQVLRSVYTGHSDTDDGTVLHVPSLGLVAAGDVVYNNVHQYLAETANGGAEAWHNALEIVSALHPRHVVAGHKDARRPDSVTDIDETHRYLEVAGALLEGEPTRAEFFERVVAHYPDRVNPFTVWLSALRLIPEEEPSR